MELGELEKKVRQVLFNNHSSKIGVFALAHSLCLEGGENVNSGMVVEALKKLKGVKIRGYRVEEYPRLKPAETRPDDDPQMYSLWRLVRA